MLIVFFKEWGVLSREMLPYGLAQSSLLLYSQLFRVAHRQKSRLQKWSEDLDLNVSTPQVTTPIPLPPLSEPPNTAGEIKWTEFSCRASYPSWAENHSQLFPGSGALGMALEYKVTFQSLWKSLSNTPSRIQQPSRLVPQACNPSYSTE